MTEKNNYDFNFEIDNSVHLTHKEAIKIFGHDEKLIKKITTYSLIFGGIFLIPFIFRNIISLVIIFSEGYFFSKPSILNYLGLTIILSALYVRKNFRKNPMIIVYNNKILFKNKRTYTNLPLLRILDLYDLYRMENYMTLQKSEIKFVVNPESNFLDNRPYFELKSNSLKYLILLNVDKDYQKYINNYLFKYLENDKTK